MSFAVFALARAHRGLAATLLSDLGLHPGQDLVLMQLLDADGRSQTSLVEALRLDPSTVARSVRRLEAAGLVGRRRSAADGRVQVVSLTDRGRAAGEQARAAWAELEDRTAAALDEGQRAQLVTLARTLAARLEQR